MLCGKKGRFHDKNPSMGGLVAPVILLIRQLPAQVLTEKKVSNPKVKISFSHIYIDEFVRYTRAKPQLPFDISHTLINSLIKRLKKSLTTLAKIQYTNNTKYYGWCGTRGTLSSRIACGNTKWYNHLLRYISNFLQN